MEGRRLASFCDAVRQAIGSTVHFLQPDPFNSDQLIDCDVLLITTLRVQLTNVERDLIIEFVDRGGGLFIMSNHGAWPGKNPNDWTRDDRIITHSFGVTLHGAHFHTRDAEHTEMTDEELNVDHPIIRRNADMTNQVRSLRWHSCCAISCPSGDWLARLPPTMVDERTGSSPDQHLFAHALAYGDGRVVTVADSGFIADPSPNHPQSGFANHAPNLLFVTNAIKWLAEPL